MVYLQTSRRLLTHTTSGRESSVVFIFPCLHLSSSSSSSPLLHLSSRATRGSLTTGPGMYSMWQPLPFPNAVCSLYDMLPRLLGATQHEATHSPPSPNDCLPAACPVKVNNAIRCDATRCDAMRICCDAMRSCCCCSSCSYRRGNWLSVYNLQCRLSMSAYIEANSCCASRA